MISIKTTINDIGLRVGLGRIEQRMRNPSLALQECGLILLRSIAKTFEAGGRPKKWPVSLRAKATGGRTLIKTARLMRSITMDVQGDTLSVGTNVKQARIHQLGGTIKPRTAKELIFFAAGIGWRIVKKVTIPARPFLVVQDEDWRMFKRIVADYVTEG
ncbi:MAG: phage virion morphogenesis protein [Deltaproteobacteria bacterium]|nr:phage virion morphogenesis protein [Deltaproteobacteria bacterium]